MAFCEKETFPQSILKKHWPDVPVFHDVKKLTAEELINEGINSIDIICGGLPCQPFSVAGKQKGKKDDRYLWPEMFRLIREIKPAWVICENVAGFIRLALDDVLLDLENEGYTSQSFVIPASAVGGVHRRDRVWIVAYAESNGNSRIGRKLSKKNEEQSEQKKSRKEKTRESINGCSDSREISSATTDTQHNGLLASSKLLSDEETGTGRSKKESKSTKQSERKSEPANVSGLRRSPSGKQRHDAEGTMGQGGCIENASDPLRPRVQAGISKPKQREEGNTKIANNNSHRRPCRFRQLEIPTQSPVCHRNDGVSNNVAKLKALGNAVVPQIPELIGRAINIASKS